MRDWLDAMRATVPLVRLSPWFAGILAVFAIALLALGNPAPAVFGLVAAAVIIALPYWQASTSMRGHPLGRRAISGEADEHVLTLTIGNENSADRDADADAIIERAHTELHWPRMLDWRKTATCVVLHTRTGDYVVPRRAFADPNELLAFHALLARKLGPAGSGSRSRQTAPRSAGDAADSAK